MESARAISNSSKVQKEIKFYDILTLKLTE